MGRPAAVCIALGLLLALASCGKVTATISPAPSSADSTVVAWRPLPEVPRAARPIVPSPPVPIPPGTPSCRGADLEGERGPADAGFGHLDLPVILRNRGSSLCYLEGYPDVAIYGQGRLLAQAAGFDGRGTFFNDGPVVPVLMPRAAPAFDPTAPPLNRGERGQAFMNLEWFDCAQPRADTVVLTLSPEAGGQVSVPFAIEAPFSLACESRTVASNLGRGPFSPSGYLWPPSSQSIPVSITLDLPATVRSGSTLAYTVTIRNHGDQAYALAPCPNYLESIGGKAFEETFQLNCAQVDLIASGKSLTFAMRLDVPKSFPPGATSLNWVLLDGRITGSNSIGPLEILSG